jgi:signal transduction histidine kinase
MIHLGKYVVLIIDDDELRRAVINAALRGAPENYTALIAPNGILGCRIAQAQMPDLILLSWIMPEMSGLEVLLVLKENPATRDIPVIAITSLESSKHVEYALNAGATDYLRAPVDGVELLARARAAVHIAESNRQIKEQAARLEEQNRRLVELNRDKNEFLGIAAHDLKNPLSNIMNIASLLETERESLPEEEVAECIRLIGASATKMFELVCNLLDVNAIEHGAVRLNPTLFDARNLARRVMETYAERALKKNVFFVSEFPENPLHIYADEQIMTHILDNLVSNAVKYSPRGKPVSVRLSASPARNGANPDAPQLLLVEIRDYGEGISPADIKKLFGKFQRLSAKPTGGEHSTGLGLSIVKSLVEQMCGKVWCESVQGEGAAFFVELPMRP